jgi:Protein of unknown function (DUF3300)
MRTLEMRPKPLMALLLALLIVALPASIAQQPSAPAASPPSQQDLDQLLAPIALYPDALIAQMLMAATYPLEIVEAARWASANPNVKDQALEDAMAQQSWDPSVKGLVSVPQVLQHMSENLSWTQKLGDAMLADQNAVMATVQNLRAKAQAAGNLKSTPEQTVKTEMQETRTVYIIQSPQPQVVYVPTYNPYTVYGTWWYPYPPYYMYPPAYVYPPGLAFATGIVVGAAIWGNCNWRGGSVNVNINNYNRYNRTTINNNNWNHNVNHRKGVAYRDPSTAQKYNRGGDARAAQSREAFRGRTDSGLSNNGNLNRGTPQNSNLNRGTPQNPNLNRGTPQNPNLNRDTPQNRAADRGGGASPASRDVGRSGSRDAGNGGGFSGAGSGAATRQASSLGGTSRGAMRGGGNGRQR